MDILREPTGIIAIFHEKTSAGLATSPSEGTVHRMKILFTLALVFPLFSHAQFNGVPFVDDAARCVTVTDEISPAQLGVIQRSMNDHLPRLFHWLWHSTRNGWSTLTPNERMLVQSLSDQWGQNAPICPAPNRSNQNPAGEEFLRMHHQMIDYVRSQLVANQLPCLTGWSAIPQAGDLRWPIPAGAPDDSSKSAEVGRLLRMWSLTFMNPGFLQSHTLSEVGYLLEFSIHNNLHMRWSDPTDFGGDYSPVNAQVTTLDALLAPTQFDSTQFHSLANPYSSALSPVFWKLHGWVDNVIVAWLRANNLTFIADNCQGNTQTCYQWRSQWIGGMDHAHPAAGGGAPMGGGGPMGNMDMRGRSGNSPGLSEALGKIAPLASFRNRAFDQFLSQPRGGAGPGSGGGVAAGSDLDDPAVFVERFGPCSSLPSFLR